MFGNTLQIVNFLENRPSTFEFTGPTRLFVQVWWNDGLGADSELAEPSPQHRQ